MSRPVQSLEDYANESTKPLQESLQRAADSGLCGILPMVTKEGSGEDTVLTLHGITIVPTLIPRGSILGPIHINGWKVSDWRFRSDPDDVDEVEIEIGSDSMLGAVVRMVMTAIFTRKYEGWCHQEGCQALASLPDLL